MESQADAFNTQSDNIDLGELPENPEEILQLREFILTHGKTDEFIRKTLNQAQTASPYRSEITITQSHNEKYFHIQNQYLSDFLSKNPDRLDLTSEQDGSFLEKFSPYTRYTTSELFVQSIQEGYLLSIGIKNPHNNKISWVIRPIDLDELVATSTKSIMKKTGESLKSWRISDDLKWIYIEHLNFHDTRLVLNKFPSRSKTPHDIQQRTFSSLWEKGNEEIIESIFTNCRTVLYPTYDKKTLLRLIQPDPVIDYIFYPPFETDYQRAQTRDQIIKQIETIK